MKIECVWEHNGSDILLFAKNFPGAYSGVDVLFESERPADYKKVSSGH